MKKDYDYYANIGYETVRDYFWDSLIWLFLLVFAAPAMGVWYTLSVPFYLLGKHIDNE